MLTSVVRFKWTNSFDQIQARPAIPNDNNNGKGILTDTHVKATWADLLHSLQPLLGKGCVRSKAVVVASNGIQRGICVSAQPI